jgi:hypothetical protein
MRKKHERIGKKEGEETNIKWGVTLYKTIRTNSKRRIAPRFEEVTASLIYKHDVC